MLAQCTHELLMRILSARISSLRGYSVHAWDPFAYAPLLSVSIRSLWRCSAYASVPYVESTQNEHLKIGKTYSYAQCTHEFHTPMLSIRISPLCVHLGICLIINMKRIKSNLMKFFARIAYLSKPFDHILSHWTWATSINRWKAGRRGRDRWMPYHTTLPCWELVQKWGISDKPRPPSFKLPRGET